MFNSENRSRNRRAGIIHILGCCGLALSALGFSAAQPAHAAVNLDLSYVNPQSTQFARFKSVVDNAVAGNPTWGFSATDAAYMYKLTGQLQYGQLAVQMVDSQVNAANAAIAAGSVPKIAGDSYLDVGPMLSDLALAYDWCSTLTTAAQRTRWATYADQAVTNVWSPSQAKWGSVPAPWSGWSTNDPGDNYYYSFVQATMLWALASNNATWKTYLQNDRLPLLQNYFAALPGGGSLEGTGYGLSHRTMFGDYQVWRDATGSDIANANSHLTDSIYYWIHATVPTFDKVAPIGDQARVSMPVIYDYHRTLMLEARRLTSNAAAANAASWWLNHISIQSMTNGFNARFDLLPAGTSTTPPAALTYHASGVGQLFSRTSWDTTAMWLSFTAGPYEQSHAHQDQGAFALYAGDWLTVTENIWSHSGINQGTDTNNVVRFERNGTIVPQKVGTVSTMTVTGTGAAGEVHAMANLTPAYGNSPGVQSWQRNIDFVNHILTVHDTFAVDSSTQGIFQLNVPVKPTISGNTATAGHLKITVLQPANATLSIVNWTGVNVPSYGADYGSGYRLDVRGGATGYVVQLSTDLPVLDAPTAEIFASGFD